MTALEIVQPGCSAGPNRHRRMLVALAGLSAGVAVTGAALLTAQVDPPAASTPAVLHRSTDAAQLAALKEAAREGTAAALAGRLKTVAVAVAEGPANGDGLRTEQR